MPIENAKSSSYHCLVVNWPLFIRQIKELIYTEIYIHSLGQNLILSDHQSDSFRQNFIPSNQRSEHSDRQDLLTTDNKFTCRSLTSHLPSNI